MSLDEILGGIKKQLIFTKEAEVAGIKFILGVLSLEEEQKASSLPNEDDDGMAYYNEMRKHILSYAIRQVNGEEIPSVVETAEGDAKVTKEKSIYLREFLSSLPGHITDQLFDIYIDLREESESDVEKDVKYNWFKTPEQREKEREEQEKKRAEEEAQEESKAKTEDVETKDINLKKLDEPEEETEKDK